MQPTVHCRSAAQLVSHVASLFVGDLRDNLVILPLCGSAGGATLRVDLPPAALAAEPASARAFARHLVGLAVQVDGTSAIAVIVLSRRPVADIAGRSGGIVAALEEAAAGAGVRVHEPAYLAADGWGVFRPGGEPGPAHTLECLPAVATPSRPEHRRRARSRPLADAAAPPLTSTSAAIARDLDAADDDARLHALLEGALERDDLRLRPSELDAVVGATAAHLVAGIERVCCFLGTAWFAGHDRPSFLDALEHCLEPTPSPAVARRLRDAFDVDRCVRAVELVRHAARRLDYHERAHAFALLAWLCWAAGQGSRAAAWALRALDIEPAHSLARHALEFADTGRTPPWFGKSPAWYREDMAGSSDREWHVADALLARTEPHDGPAGK